MRRPTSAAWPAGSEAARTRQPRRERWEASSLLLLHWRLRLRSTWRHARGRCPRRSRAGVVLMLRLERHRRGAAKRLQVRDHAEDLLIGETDWRLVDGGHPRIESRHDECVRFVQRLRQVLDVAQARDSALRADTDAIQIGEPQRATLAPGVAGGGGYPSRQHL